MTIAIVITQLITLPSPVRNIYWSIKSQLLLQPLKQHPSQAASLLASHVCHCRQASLGQVKRGGSSSMGLGCLHCRLGRLLAPWLLDGASRPRGLTDAARLGLAWSARVRF